MASGQNEIFGLVEEKYVDLHGPLTQRDYPGFTASVRKDWVNKQSTKQVLYRKTSFLSFRSGFYSEPACGLVVYRYIS